MTKRLFGITAFSYLWPSSVAIPVYTKLSDTRRTSPMLTVCPYPRMLTSFEYSLYLMRNSSMYAQDAILASVGQTPIRSVLVLTRVQFFDRVPS